MIAISKQVEYAIEFVLRLSKLDDGEVLSLRQFSSESTISFLFLQRIARSLKLAGIVTSTKGTKGGYALLQPLSELNLLSLAQAIDEAPAVVPCIKSDYSCDKEATCTIQTGMHDLQKQLTSLMKNTRIESLTV